MRRVLAAFVLVAGWVAAEEPSAERASPAQAADAVAAAVRAKDGAALEVLAARDDPDPWLVAEVLLARGVGEAAAAFAAAASGPDVHGLASYVARTAGAARPLDLEEAIDAAEAAAAKGDGVGALLRLQGRTVSEDLVLRVRLLYARGSALDALSRASEAEEAFTEAAALAASIGWLSRAALSLDRLALLAGSRADMEALERVARRRLALAKVRRRAEDEAEAITSWAVSLVGRRRAGEAVPLLRQALETYEHLADAPGIARSEAMLGSALYASGDIAEALEVEGRAVAAWRAQGNRAELLAALWALGSMLDTSARYAEALDAQEEALDLAEALGDARRRARVLLALGGLYHKVGDLTRALLVLDAAAGAWESLGGTLEVTRARLMGGRIHRELGDFGRARVALEDARGRWEQAGDSARQADADFQMGLLAEAMGDAAGAIARYESAQALRAKAGVRDANTLARLALLREARGEEAEARAMLEKALVLASSDIERAGVRAQQARLLAASGQGDLAIAALEAATAHAASAGAVDLEVEARARIAALHLGAGRPRQALAAAREAAERSEAVGRGLAEGQGAFVREEIAHLFETGVAAALALSDLESVVLFLEAGRAATLLEVLGGSEGLRAAFRTGDLKAEEGRARQREAEAQRALAAALEGPDRRLVKEAKREREAARTALGRVLERLERRRRASVEAARRKPDSLAALRARLREGEALILYGVLRGEGLAVVVEPGGARTVRLGPVADLERLLERADFSIPVGDGQATLAAVASLTVAPLRLSDSVTHLLVSPAGPYVEVPFPALAGSRSVALVPSGTVHGALRDRGSGRGEGVLALGDPVYDAPRPDARAAVLRAGQALIPLPATREEARAVGTEVLLGADASEIGLRRALAGHGRWRAVHLACHGLLDLERPRLSSLALSADPENDGFLTAQDVLRLECDADLVVLSACKTGRGTVVRGEGLLGLPRAFLATGARRVLVSLWAVDDEATRALMGRFYELWSPRDGSPGLPTAEALRGAQDFVRAREAWRHPHYWAAWVLWGLAE